MSRSDRRRDHWERLAQVLPWISWLLRFVVALVSLYAVLFILQTVGRLTAVAISAASPGLTVDRDSVERWARGSSLELTGRGRPFFMIDVGTGPRSLNSTLVDRRGRFRLPVFPPEGATELWVRQRQQGSTTETGRDLVLLPPSRGLARELHLDVACFVSGTNRIWVSGRSDSRRVRLLSSSNGKPLAVLPVSLDGTFDDLVRLEGDLPASLQVEAKRPGSLPLVSEATTLQEGCVLERVADLRFSASTRELRVTYSVILPAAHPFFREALSGLLDADDFLELTFGMVPVPDEATVSPELMGDIGIVRVKGSSRDVSQIAIWPSNQGIGKSPLLSSRDRIMLQFRDRPPEWLDGPLPKSMVGGRALWQGPLELRGQSIQLGITSRPSERSGSGRAMPESPQQDSQERKWRQFIRGFERSRGQFNVLRETWLLLVTLIPYAGFMVLAGRRRTARQPVTRVLGATVLLLAIWASWGYLLGILLQGPGSWLSHHAANVLWGTGLGEDFANTPDFQRFWETGSITFWLIFVALAGLTPFYFEELTQAFPTWRPPSVGGQRVWRTIWNELRFLYASALVAAFTVLTRVNPFNLEVFPGDDALGRFLLHLPESSGSFLALAAGGLALLLAVCLCALFSPRAHLLTAGILLLLVRWMAEDPQIAAAVGKGDLGAWIESFAIVSWWPILAVVTASAVPLVAGTLQALVPWAPDHRSFRWLAAAGLCGVAAFLPWLSIRLLMTAGGALLILGLGWMTIRGLPKVGILQRLDDMSRSSPTLFKTGLMTAGVIVSWPFPAPGKSLRLPDLYQLANELTGLFSYLVAAGVVLLLLERARRRPGLILSRRALLWGIYLYAFFLINPSLTWLYLPVSFVIALFLGNYWLFRPGEEVHRLRLLLRKVQGDRQAWIARLLESVSLTAHLRAIRKSLAGKLEKMEMTPEEYEAQQASYREYLARKRGEWGFPPDLSPQAAVLAAGDPSPRVNAAAATKVGALLALAPFATSLYQYLPAAEVRYPYPLADLLAFLVGASASWLLYSFFFGYFYTYLRGKSGLAKGVHLFAMILIPFASYRLLRVSPLGEMSPFLLWAAQLFLFCTLLGLLAMDYGLLRKSGFSLRDLIQIYDLPALSAYGSTVVAAVTPAILAIVTNRLGDLVKFFLDTVLPRVPT